MNNVNGIDISQHLGLAHLACKSYKVLVGRGFDYDDLFQAACEGLIYAANTYDESKGQFSTYAVPMAKKFVKRLVATQARTVKCPEYTQDRVAAAGKVKRPVPEAPRERRTSGGPFDWDQPGASVNGGRPVEAPRVRAPFEGIPSTWAAPKDEAIHAPGAELSFDFTFGEDGESTLHNTFSDETGVTPEDLAAERETRDWRANPAFQRALAGLTDQERTILVGRLEGHTQPELAAKFGVTKARIQQIEAGASRKMAEALTE
jgi:RNA polymerase sigma factor (sigma-70 family)